MAAKWFAVIGLTLAFGVCAARYAPFIQNELRLRQLSRVKLETVTVYESQHPRTGRPAAVYPHFNMTQTRHYAWMEDAALMRDYALWALCRKQLLGSTSEPCATFLLWSGTHNSKRVIIVVEGIHRTSDLSLRTCVLSGGGFLTPPATRIINTQIIDNAMPVRMANYRPGGITLDCGEAVQRDDMIEGKLRYTFQGKSGYIKVSVGLDGITRVEDDAAD